MLIRFRNFILLVIVTQLSLSTFAQNSTTDDSDWVRLKDAKLNFSIMFPSSYLSDNEVEKSYIIAPVFASLPRPIDLFEKPRVIGHAKKARMHLSVFKLRQAPKAKDVLWYFIGRDSQDSNYQDFQIGEFVGRKINYSDENTLATRIVVAIKSTVFMVDASAPVEDRKIYEKFIMSMMINGISIFKGSQSQAVDNSSTVAISALRTSPEILEALNRKIDKTEISVTKNDAEPNTEKAGRSEIKTTAGAITADDKALLQKSFSRPLIIIREPPPLFVNLAGGNSKSGQVRLQVTFLATGNIGNIVVLPDSSEVFVDSLLRSVKKTRFLPAEIDGQKVDVTRVVEHRISINYR